MLTIKATSPLAIVVKKAIQEGDLDGLKKLLAENEGLVNARIVDARGGSRTPLHLAADWPGHFPNAARTVRLLIAAGADPNAPHPERIDETPLHWAASSDDVEVLDALLDGGAEIEKPGAGIAGGTALDDAVAFGQWRAARRLVERGARTALWHAAALGLMDRVEKHFAGSPLPAPYPWGKGSAEAIDEVTIAFWCACHGGQKRAAEYLLARGAKLNWVSVWDGLTPLDAAKRANAHELVDWLLARGGTSGPSH